jgi:hypothetical protein
MPSVCTPSCAAPSWPYFHVPVKKIGLLKFERKEEDCSSDVGLSNMTERVALPFLGRGLPDIEKA